MEIKKTINDFQTIFIDTCGDPDNIDKLTEYLNFVLNYSFAFTDSDYFEIHHILPRSKFQMFESCDWNKVKLLYQDHIQAHELLAQAYITRSNLRTLNFMKSDIGKDSNMLSIASKKGWLTLKSNHEVYEKWKLSKSKYITNLPSGEQRRRSIIAWSKIKNDPTKYADRCKINKDNWTDDLRKRKSQSMKDYFEQNPNESSARGKKRWANTSIEDKTKFSCKVKESLSNSIVKEKISTKIKTKWQEDSFKEKMKNRKPSRKKYELISPTGEIFIRTGANEMILEFDFSPSLVRKFSKTEKPVESIYLKNKQVQNTIGWTFRILK